MGISDEPYPPSIIFNVKKGKQYKRLSTLGQGGFARCYKVTCEDQEYAMKCVYKKSLKNAKHIAKLKSEIKIHSQLSHDRIVNCYTCFEDREFVYLVLELCHLKTLASMLRTRQKLSEPEVRYFMLQICEGLAYLHENQFIHRDLKLGNILITKDMHLKLADFGLAAAVDNEQRKTLCGTPNYIAPEILHGTATGHSYEVDIWSFGCVMYTLLIGKPPFQAKDVNEIYKKIKKVQFEFPDSVAVSDDAKFLINACLQTKPELRPSATQLRQFSFFKQFIPALLPVSALTQTPDFDDVTPTLSQSNYKMRKSDSKQFESNILPSVPSQRESPRSKIPHYVHNNINSSPKQYKPKKSTIQQFYETLSFAVQVAESLYDNHSILFPWPRTSQTQSHILVTNTHNPFQSLFTEPVYQAPIKFVLKWIDYSNKYGLSYQITDGSVGILFNDLSSILLSPDELYL